MHFAVMVCECVCRKSVAEGRKLEESFRFQDFWASKWISIVVRIFKDGVLREFVSEMVA